MKLPSSSEMQALDRMASEEFCIPTIVLMENAGLGTVSFAEKELGSCRNTFAPVFVGPGNNGGDGLVIGRHLHQRGCQVVFFLLVHPDKLTGDPAINFKIIKELKLPYHIVDTPARAAMIPILFKQLESRGLPCFAFFDAIFGIGLCREIKDHYEQTINLINSPSFKGKAPVFSADTPSGMDTDTGNVLGCCIRADYTTTYGCAKPGHFLNGQASWTGRLEIIDIGIPPEAVEKSKIITELITSESVQPISFWLQRKKTSHKGSNGHLLVIAGSKGKGGAALLAARGALRSGAGLVTMAAPATLNDVFQNGLPEAMTLALENSIDHFSDKDFDQLFSELEKKSACVVGPGLGNDAATAALVLRLFHEAKCPVVFDADGLNILAENMEKLSAPSGPRIYTPHPGEMGRLLDKDVHKINSNRLEAAVEACNLFANSTHQTIFILKGAGTIIADDSGKRAINTSGNPGMGTAGMGDVLSGVIGALICQGFPIRDAAIVGVYLHGAAADILYEKSGSGFYATEVADMIPAARKEMMELGREFTR
jgi:hydroxyethylthiazole kinase-like uncharacterized protein yjeF